MKITNLTKQIEDFHLQIPELILEEKKIHGIIGGNGSGKSTLAKLIMGVLEPDTGTIDYGAISIDKITMTFQRPYLLQESVYDNIVYPLRIRKIKPKEEEVEEWLVRFDLQDKKKRYARSLSSGERQKLSFIRAMIFRPELVIIDETFSNLDQESVKIAGNWILENQQKRPITYLIISHQIDSISHLCDYIHELPPGHSSIG